MTITEEIPVWQGATNGPVSESDHARLNDHELAKRSASGDVEAFEQLYMRHHRRVYGICLRLMKNPTESEDLTQEVFIQLFKKIGSFRGDSAFTTWLHRMTVNQVLMHFRRKVTRVEKTTEDGEVPLQENEKSESHNGPPVIDRIALANAMAQLPPGYRTVFILHDIEGYEHEEIGRLLGCATGTSKSQLHKARMKLRSLLKRKRPR